MRFGRPAAALCMLSAVTVVAACAAGDAGAPHGRASLTMTELGHGLVGTRYTAELDVRGSIAYTTTWNERFVGGHGATGNAVLVWDVSANTPVLTDSIIIDSAYNTGDVHISDDGALLGVATEYLPGSYALFSLANPMRPDSLARFLTADSYPGVHTATFARIAGTLYAFLCVDPSQSGARLIILSLADPSHPLQLTELHIGKPYVHDVFIRGGLLFTAVWNDGVWIWDVGGGGLGGTPAAPVLIGKAATVGGNAHNVWWFHDPAANPRGDSARYMLVGEEQPGALFTSSKGDIHVIDISNMAAPREVAFFHVEGAGTHNFSVDEPNGILYAAYYNGGVRAIDVRGALGTCAAANQAPDGRCDLAAEGRELAHGLLDKGSTFVWGVKYVPPFVYASDMVDGLWKLDAIGRP